MASTGVLPFVRGIDFSGNNFESGSWPRHLSDMCSLRWVRLNKANLDKLPEDLHHLGKLEHLSLKHNNIDSLMGSELSQLSCLRSLNVGHNNLQNAGIPSDIFSLDELSVVDLSRNNLKQVPNELENAKNLTVLNLSHNEIESIPNQLFVNCTDLLYLDLSDNKLETLPPQLRRLVNLQVLIVNNNPMQHFQLRQLPSLVNMQTLHMRCTERSISNIPANLDNLQNLTDVDFSYNHLTRIPDGLYTLCRLQRLNMSHNDLKDMSEAIDVWAELQVLNVSWNNISQLPSSICKLTELRRLYTNNNNIDFDGIPSGIGKCHNLEVFMASHNRLEMVPESLCRCGKLKKIILNSNCLVTLPEAVHLLPDLKTLDVRDNDGMVMPPKPEEMQRGSGAEYYNIDFSLNHQLRLAGAAPVNTGGTVGAGGTGGTKSDPIARKIRLRTRRGAEADSDQKKVLKGMQDVAKDKRDKKKTPRQAGEDEDPGAGVKIKRWDETLERPPLDYSSLFEPDVGKLPGLTVWEIENFVPKEVDDSFHYKLFDGDCYIVLKTTLMEVSGSLDWQIFFWIGSESTLDKKASAAMHAVNLRNFLGAHGRTCREEQYGESEEFLEVFNNQVEYVEGEHVASGFYSIESYQYPLRLYQCTGTHSIHLHPVPVSMQSLHPSHVYLLDYGNELYVWTGNKSKLMTRSKARLIAEKINKHERKGEAQVTSFTQRQAASTPGTFWELLGCENGEPPDPPIKTFENSIQSPDVSLLHSGDSSRNKLYKVGIGTGYLELPQVDLPKGKLKHELLDTQNVYILDCGLDVFIWIGLKSTRLVRAAAIKLSQELSKMISRGTGDEEPDVVVTRCQEGRECQVFKSKFPGWDDVIAVDYSRSAESVRKRGADLMKILADTKPKADLSALFMPRQPAMSRDEARQLMEEWNEDLSNMSSLVLEGKKFSKLPDDEFGHFYSGDCYVFLCRYWVPIDVADDENGSNDGAENGQEEADELEEEFQYVVYFWEGRDANAMGWLQFCFGLKKKFESLFGGGGEDGKGSGNKLEISRMHQQQENLKFLSHFKSKFVIHNGKRTVAGCKDSAEVELYQIRSSGGLITTRCIQVAVDSALLNPHFTYILRVPFNGSDQMGITYVWLGSKCDYDEARIAEDIARDMFDDSYSIQTIGEGEEPENFFWVGIGSKKPYEESALFMDHMRLFRCSNDKGYFTVSEKCSDFCQDDLAPNDVMILDTGEQIYLWMGPHSSEIEVKLAFKSAQVYMQNLRVKQSDLPRKLFVCIVGKESRKFTKCFHGWGKYRFKPR